MITAEDLARLADQLDQWSADQYRAAAHTDTKIYEQHQAGVFDGHDEAAHWLRTQAIAAGIQHPPRPVCHHDHQHHPDTDDLGRCVHCRAEL